MEKSRNEKETARLTVSCVVMLSMMLAYPVDMPFFALIVPHSSLSPQTNAPAVGASLNIFTRAIDLQLRVSLWESAESILSIVRFVHIVFLTNLVMFDHFIGILFTSPDY
jgi:hypothetical protein